MATLTRPEAAQRPTGSSVPLSAENQDPAPTRGEVVIYVASSHHTPVMCPGWRDAKGLLRGWA